MTGRILGEFDGPEAILEAARVTSAAGLHRVVDAFTPMPVEGLVEAIRDERPSRVRLALLLGGLVGALAGAALQWWSATVALPLMVGGRAFASWPDFLFATFELAILGAALAGFIALLAGCGLPRLHHPLFAVEGFERATQDRFFLEVEADDAADAAEARASLHGLGALRVVEVPS